MHASPRSHGIWGKFFYICLSFVRLLTVMGQPFAFGQLHIGKDRLEGGILRGAGIDAEADFAPPLPYMANTHLGEGHTIGGHSMQ